MTKIAKNATIGESYDPAMKITDQKDALEYFEALVLRNMERSGHSRKEAEDIERQNLAYYAGYFDGETRRRVERLFSCAHPVFGAIAEKGEPTPEEAFKMGTELGGKMARTKKNK
jgi:hypothetical protein